MGIVLALRDLWIGWRLRRASRQDIGDKQCVACDSLDVTSLAPGVYRCRDCGHEGGDGYPAYQRRKRLEQFDRLGEHERRKSAEGDLREAQRLLISAKGSLKAAADSSVMDIVDVSDGPFGIDDGGEKQSEYLTAHGLLVEAGVCLENSVYKLGKGAAAAGETQPSDPDYDDWAMDTAMDNLASDLKFHRTIKKTQELAEAMLARVEKLLTEEFG